MGERIGLAEIKTEQRPDGLYFFGHGFFGHAHDRSKWGADNWATHMARDEPDAVWFEHAGFRCMLNRCEGSGHWCGYVDVPVGHPDHGTEHYKCDVECHGGVTYNSQASFHEGFDGDTTAWRIGFDCGHSGDASPGRERYSGYDMYRDIRYVRAETERMAEQFRARSAVNIPLTPPESSAAIAAMESALEVIGEQQEGENSAVLRSAITKIQQAPPAPKEGTK